MKRTFASEDNRKSKLFTLWIAFLGEIHAQFEKEDFDEIYEGVAHVAELSESRISFHLDDGRKVRGIAIPSEISVHSATQDMLYVLLGRKKGKWWPIDVISIGSIVDFEAGQVHMTFNPLLGEQLGAQ